MPPQNTSTPPPAAPGQFDFLMKAQPKPSGRFSSLLAGLPKPARIALAVLGTLFILVILYALLFGGKSVSTNQLTSLMADAREISRVSDLVQQQAQTIDTKDLAATTKAILSSQEQELRSYLKTNKVKIDDKKLAAKQDKNTDSRLNAALQNNNYDQTYFNYLKTSLINYQNSLGIANKEAPSELQAILKTDSASIQTLLTMPRLRAN